MNILITGGAGFIGSNFICYFLKKYPHYKIFNLDSLTYAGNLANLEDIHDAPEKYPNYVFLHGDICDSVFVQDIFRKYDIDAVIHFAAESHVDNSIINPDIFIKTNVYGTFNLLHTAYVSWYDAPFSLKTSSHKKPCIFHHISTDEVFGSLDIHTDDVFSETTPYAPNSPYSASKASSDMLTRSYHHTYGLNIVVTNCSNNYGPKQHDEKLIPTIIRNALQGLHIPIYGDGKNVRDWLFVQDHCKAIDEVFHSQKFGETFAVGGNCEKANIDLAKEICTILDKKIPKKDNSSYCNQIQFVTDRAGHDKRYAINSSKMQKTFNWQPSDFTTNLQTTIDWYIKRYKNIL